MPSTHKSNLFKMKGGAYIINLDEYEWLRTYWIALQVSPKNVTCFDNFWVEHIPKENWQFIGNRNVKYL